MLKDTEIGIKRHNIHDYKNGEKIVSLINEMSVSVQIKMRSKKKGLNPKKKVSMDKK